MSVELIAEFCQNHNGDFGILSEMVFAAAECGATAGKMQTIFADRVSCRPQFEEGLVQNGVRVTIKRPYWAEYERLKKLEIDFHQQEEFIRLCKKAGITPMTTCFSRDTAQQIHDVGFREVKVASYDCASFQMLRELRPLFERVLISTGATFNDELEYAASLMKGSNFGFLHCVTLYPTPLGEMHLARLKYLRQFAPKVGFSDHSLVARDGVIASQVAVYLGAEMIERHFTVLPSDQTRDGPVSITPALLKELSSFSKLSSPEQREYLDSHYTEWNQCIGLMIQDLSPPELLNRDYYRGRFASLRKESKNGQNMIFNWEETPLK